MAIRTRVGETFVIELEGSPTAGYLWHPEESSSAEFLERSFEPPRSDAIGAATTERLTFRCNAAGTFTLTVHHRRPWEASARESRTFSVTASGR